MVTSLSQAQPAQVVHLLLVAEHQATIQQVRRMLLLGRITNPLRIFGPDEAIVLLRHDQAPRVRRLILLDIDSPQRPSFKMLRQLRKDPQLGEIPVVALYSTELERQRLDATELRADGYLPHPLDPTSFMALMVSLQRYGSFIASDELAPADR